MPTITVIESTPAPERAEAAPKPRRVAAYARVSTEKDEQQTSYEAQRNYYTRLIASRPDWTLAGVYADEYSGTGTKKRDGFRRMIEDALAGGIDLIVTKSVARFARNTVDSLTHIRLLREHGTEVYFEKENIRTFDEKGELMLTILSSLAQEESRSISENVTWGMRESMRRGNAWVPYKSFLGYDRAPDGSMAVNPEQAAAVRRVYGLFLAGLTPYGVARALEGEGVPFAAGREKWYASTVLSILRNEKYKGDALRQKTYSKSYLTKERAVNNGELRKYYIAGHHEAIVSPAVFDLVQRELKEREGEPRAAEGVFARRVFCAECGGVMGRFTRRRGGAETRSLRCSGRKCGRCSAPPVPEEELKAAFTAACAARFDVAAAEATCAEAVGAAVAETVGAIINRPRTLAPASEAQMPPPPFDETLFRCVVERVTVSRAETVFTFRDGSAAAVPRP